MGSSQCKPLDVNSDMYKKVKEVEEAEKKKPRNNNNVPMAQEQPGNANIPVAKRLNNTGRKQQKPTKGTVANITRKNQEKRTNSRNSSGKKKNE